MLPSPEYARLFARRARILSLLPDRFIRKFGLRWLERQIETEATNAEPGELEFWVGETVTLINEFLAQDRGVS
jgi:hypothetical protein